METTITTTAAAADKKKYNNRLTWACGFVLVAGVLAIVATATKGWVEGKDGQYEVKFGLWEICAKVPTITVIVSPLPNSNFTQVSPSPSSSNVSKLDLKDGCQSATEAVDCSTFKSSASAAQAFSIIGIIFTAFTGYALYHYYHHILLGRPWKQKAIRRRKLYWILGVIIASPIALFVCWVIIAASWNSRTMCNKRIQTETSAWGYSYWLQLVSWILSGLAAFILVRVLYYEHYKKKKGPPALIAGFSKQGQPNLDMSGVSVHQPGMPGNQVPHDGMYPIPIDTPNQFMAAPFTTPMQHPAQQTPGRTDMSGQMGQNNYWMPPPVQLSPRQNAPLQGFGGGVRPTIGLAVQMINDSFGNKDCVVMVAGLQPKGPSEKAGLQVGDLVLKWDGINLDSRMAFQERLSNTPIGADVQLVIYRSGSTLNKVVRVEGTVDNKQ